MKRTTKTLLASTVGAAGLFLASTTNASASTTVKVNQNDTVWALSQKYGVSIKSIETLNHIDQNKHLILVNQSLAIPNKETSTKTTNSSNTQSTNATSVVKVSSGDSLWKIANSYNITVDQLRTLNGLSSDETLILPGQELKVSGTPKAAATTTTAKAADTTSATQSSSQKTQAATSSAATTTQQATQVTVSANHVTYTVKAGDSLYTVAQAYGVSVDSLRASNKLGSTLTIGQTLTINDPTKTPATQTASSAASSSTTASSAASTTTATQQSSSSSAQTASSATQSSTAQQTSAAQSSSQSSTVSSATQSSTAQQTATVQSAATSSSSSVQSASPRTATAATTVNAASSSTTTQSSTVKTVSSGSITSIATQIASMGVPYVTGGTTLSGFDCSGFTQYVYAKAGISIPRTSQAQSAIGTYESVSNAQVGDLLFWGGRGSAYHVGIYLGGSSYAAAPEEGENVSIKSFTYYQPSFAVHVN